MKIAEVGLKVMIVFTVLLVISLIGQTIHSEFDPDFYNQVVIDTSKGSSLLVLNHSVPEAPLTFSEYTEIENKKIYLSRLTLSSKLIFLVRKAVGVMFILLTLNYLLRFVSSVRKLETFFEDNIVIFKKMGVLWLVATLLTVLNSMTLNSMTMEFPDNKLVYNANQYIDIGGILGCAGVALFSFIANEVFKEGAKLRSENLLTI